MENHVAGRVKVRVKICGITRQADAEAAVEAGANALGFVFWRGSQRRVDADLARRICRDLPERTARVGVFVDAEASTVESTMRDAELTVAQLHGAEDPEYRDVAGAIAGKIVTQMKKADLL